MVKVTSTCMYTGSLGSETSTLVDLLHRIPFLSHYSLEGEDQGMDDRYCGVMAKEMLKSSGVEGGEDRTSCVGS